MSTVSRAAEAAGLQSATSGVQGTAAADAEAQEVLTPAGDAGELAVVGAGAVRVVDELEAPIGILEDPAPAERIAELELAIDSLGSALDNLATVNDEQRRENGRLEQRITHLEARTRDATVNADIVSLQGKVSGLEDQVGARQAVAIAELLSRVDALEAGT